MPAFLWIFEIILLIIEDLKIAWLILQVHADYALWLLLLFLQ